MKPWLGTVGALLLTAAGCGGAREPAGPPSAAPPGDGASPRQAATLSAAASAASTSGGVKEKVRVGYLSRAGTSSLNFVSKNAGLYDKYGLDVELTFAQPAILTTALNAGKD